MNNMGLDEKLEGLTEPLSGDINSAFLRSEPIKNQEDKARISWPVGMNQLPDILI